jgi:Uma2 family endonuclease
MASPILPSFSEEMEYPTGDGQPMAETPVHRDNMTDTIAVLRRRYVHNRNVYVSGNMFVYYEEGNRRRHVSPDVFAVFGVPDRLRDCYKTWEEPKPTLDLIVEYTSKSTKDEDLEHKFFLYQDVLRVQEYLLFDPYAEYLDPPEQLFRLVNGIYQPVEPVDGRLPSEVLGLHFERDGWRMRLYVPETGLWLPTPQEEADQARSERDAAAARLQQAEAEIERLRRELDQLRGGPGERGA